MPIHAPLNGWTAFRGDLQPAYKDDVTKDFSLNNRDENAQPAQTQAAFRISAGDDEDCFAEPDTATAQIARLTTIRAGRCAESDDSDITRLRRMSNACRGFSMRGLPRLRHWMSGWRQLTGKELANPGRY